MGMPALREGFEIDNPKDVISQQLPNITTFQEHLDFISILLANDTYGDSMSDIVNGASMLALMVSQSVTSMSQVLKVGKEYKENWTKEVVLLFVTAFLLVIHSLGEITEGADLPALRAMLRIIGEAGNGGLAAYDIVNSKDGGPAAILLALLGGIGALDMIRAPSYFRKAAKARNRMSAAHITTLGPEVKGGMAQIDKLKAKYF